MIGNIIIYQKLSFQIIGLKSSAGKRPDGTLATAATRPD
jgi:hypothetical protein